MKSNFEQLLERVKTLPGADNVSGFARSVGMNQKTVDLYMKGERKPSLEFVLSICSSFDISADWLLGLTSTPKCIEPNEASHRAQEAERKLGAVQEALSLILQGTQKLQEAVR